jgi:hypothetical protein
MMDFDEFQKAHEQQEPEIKCVRLPPVDGIYWPKEPISTTGDPSGAAPAETRIAALEAQVVTLTAQVEALANHLSQFAERQLEMKKALLAAGAFEKKSAIIMPGRPN